MEKITKLHPVFLTFEGWVSTEGDVTIPENTMGGCPKCWSPVVREELSNNGVCVCCGLNDNLIKVFHSVELMSMQIQYNSSKHLPGGALPFLEYWKSRRNANIALMMSSWFSEHILLTEGILDESCNWKEFHTESIEARKVLPDIFRDDGSIDIYRVVAKSKNYKGETK